ncbi:MAG: hypothetical protein CFE21_10190 [Bacteroidetes bacterium B1(2017)]|nr:MAG: hypothetical protein CFE21_10190 [Bacteroidetes bacterium B1(2017)]
MENHSSKRFHFWQRWLFYTSILFALAGVLLAFAGNSVLFKPYSIMLAKALWNQANFPVQVEPFKAFIYMPFGGTIACCYILLAFIAKYPFKEKKLWARNAILIAFSSWVLIDSLGCYYFRVYPQIYLINAFSILVKALPILFTWKEFR